MLATRPAWGFAAWMWWRTRRPAMVLGFAHALDPSVVVRNVDGFRPAGDPHRQRRTAGFERSDQHRGRQSAGVVFARPPCRLGAFCWLAGAAGSSVSVLARRHRGCCLTAWQVRAGRSRPNVSNGYSSWFKGAATRRTAQQRHHFRRSVDRWLPRQAAGSGVDAWFPWSCRILSGPSQSLRRRPEGRRVSLRGGPRRPCPGSRP
jgi:hypothetical protein